MITKITDKDKYESLFQRAWDDLYERGDVFTDGELTYYAPLGNKFTCLEEYFTRIKTLINTDSPNYEYILLPLDEPRFEINADTREITIPAGFKRLVGVAGDHYAEMLIFSIDRFFDFADLLNTTIYIQWIDDEGNDNATPIDIVHYDAASGKILFGWPLDEKVTKTARTINFSVRFFIKEGEKITYSFNTKIHQITIAPALQPDLNADIIIDTSTAAALLGAIQDSPSSATPPAADPTFAAPGLDLQSEIELTDVAYQLKVQAVASDTGNIEYDQWSYVSEDGENALLSGTYVYDVVETPDNDGKTIYYIYDDGEYKKYTGPITASTSGLYERYWSYTIPSTAAMPAGGVTGTYKAYAKNRLGPNVSKRIESQACVVAGPGTAENVKYGENGDLPDYAIIDTFETLGVDFIVPAPGKTTINYTWKYSDTSRDSLAVETELGTDSSIDAEDLEPGWYQVISSATRNRKTINVPSTICKITNAPVAVELKTNAQTNYELEADVNQDLTVEIENFATPSELYSDEVEYVWEAQVAGEGFKQLEDTSADRLKYRIANTTTEFNTGTIVVYGGPGNDLNATIAYRCTVTNKLNGAVSSPATRVFTVS